MHPFSPHARTTPKTTNTSPTRRFASQATAAPARPAPIRPFRGGGKPAGDPLEVLAKEIHGKLVAGTSAAKAHVAAEELTLRRPRRPAARRAGFRTPPASR